MLKYLAPSHGLPVASKITRSSACKQLFFREFQKPAQQKVLSRNYTSSTASVSSQKKPSNEQVLTLPSGRLLGYHTYGDPKGIPLIYIHSVDSGSMESDDDPELVAASKFGIRWIGPNRPGVGKSTAYDGQEIIDYPQDIQHLVDHLDLNEFYIYGAGWGASYTLACAKDLDPKRLKGVGIYAGYPPIECEHKSPSESVRSQMESWRLYPKEMEAAMMSMVEKVSQMDTKQVIASMNEDQERDPSDPFNQRAAEVMSQVEDSDFMQTAAQTIAMSCNELKLNTRPWGFKLEDIKFPGIRFWYKEDDITATPAMGRYMAERIPGAIYTEFPGFSQVPPMTDAEQEQVFGELLGVKR